MAATARTFYYTGGSPSASADVIGGTAYYKRADNITVDNNNPIPKPTSAGENLSWGRWSKMDWSTTPAGIISNLRYFVSTPPTGIKHYARAEATYTQAASGDEAGISGFTNNQTNKDLFDEANHTSASPLVVNSGTVLSNPSTGVGTQDYVQSQLGVKDTYAGGPGAISAITATYRYNET